MTAEQFRYARDLLTQPDNAVSSIARLIGVSRAAIYKYVPELPARARATAWGVAACHYRRPCDLDRRGRLS